MRFRIKTAWRVLTRGWVMELADAQERPYGLLWAPDYDHVNDLQQDTGVFMATRATGRD